MLPLVNERLVWIDCEMTGLDLVADALIEVAALVTDFDLNVLGDGIDIVIKPPAEALDQMIPFVRAMHENSGLLDELDDGVTLAEAEEQVLAYIRSTARRRQPPAAGRQHGRRPTGPSSPATCPTLDAFLHYRIVDVSSIKELSRRWFPTGLLRRAGQARQPPRAGRHPGEHRGAALLPRGGLRAAPRARTRRRARAIALRHGGSLTGLPEPAPDSDDSARFRLHSLAGPRHHRDRLVGIAQLVERRVVVADVAGSSPVTHPSTPATAARARPIASGSPPAVACTSAPS